MRSRQPLSPAGSVGAPAAIGLRCPSAVPKTLRGGSWKCASSSLALAIAARHVGLLIVAAAAAATTTPQRRPRAVPSTHGAREEGIKVGMVTDIGGLNDRSFNALANQGLERAKRSSASTAAS